MSTMSRKALRRWAKDPDSLVRRRHARKELARRRREHFMVVAGMCQILSLPVAVWAVLK